MTERRRFSRIRKRYPVEFRVAGKTCLGFTHNVSPIGLFVCSVYFPRPGSRLWLRIKVAEGKSFLMRVEVVRSYRVPQQLTRSVRPASAVRSHRPPEAS